MKTKLVMLCVSILLSVGLLIPSSASAWYYRGYHPYYHHYYYGYGYRMCKWVGGYWRHGHWMPAHRVCWRVR